MSYISNFMDFCLYIYCSLKLRMNRFSFLSVFLAFNFSLCHLLLPYACFNEQKEFLKNKERQKMPEEGQFKQYKHQFVDTKKMCCIMNTTHCIFLFSFALLDLAGTRLFRQTGILSSYFIIPFFLHALSFVAFD